MTIVDANMTMKKRGRVTGHVFNSWGAKIKSLGTEDNKMYEI